MEKESEDISSDSGDLFNLPLPTPRAVEAYAKACEEIKKKTEDISWDSGDVPNVPLPDPSKASANSEVQNGGASNVPLPGPSNESANSEMQNGGASNAPLAGQNAAGINSCIPPPQPASPNPPQAMQVEGMDIELLM